MQMGYFKSAWNDVKGSPGWVGKMFILTLLLFIPIFGQIVVYGYLFGWARDAAWGLQSPLPRKIFANEDGKLYSRGFFILVLGLVLSIVPVVLLFVTLSLAGAMGVGVAHDRGAAFAIIIGLLTFVAGVATFAAIFVVIFINWVGSMRISIYGNLSAGFQFKKIIAMIKKDFNGLLRIFGMYLILSICLSIISSILSSVIGFVIAAVAIGAVGSSIGLSNGADTSSIGMIVAAGGVSIVLSLMLAYITAVLGVFIQTMVTRALGYWLRFFDVPSWRGQDDPMPFELQQAMPPMYQTAPPVYQATPQAQQAVPMYQQQYAPPVQQGAPIYQGAPIPQGTPDFSQATIPGQYPGPESQQGTPPAYQTSPEAQQGMPPAYQAGPEAQQGTPSAQQQMSPEIPQAENDVVSAQQDIPSDQQGTPPAQ